jgi:hypothetical protein
VFRFKDTGLSIDGTKILAMKCFADLVEARAYAESVKARIGIRTFPDCSTVARFGRIPAGSPIYARDRSHNPHRESPVAQFVWPERIPASRKPSSYQRMLLFKKHGRASQITH